MAGVVFDRSANDLWKYLTRGISELAGDFWLDYKIIRLARSFERQEGSKMWMVTPCFFGRRHGEMDAMMNTEHQLFSFLASISRKHDDFAIISIPKALTRRPGTSSIRFKEQVTISYYHDSKTSHLSFRHRHERFRVLDQAVVDYHWAFEIVVIIVVCFIVISRRQCGWYYCRWWY